MSATPTVLERPLRRSAPRTPSRPTSAGEARALGASRLRARRALTRRIRRTVAIATVCVFLATWLLIFEVLVSGHDPALSRAAHRAATSVTTTSGTSSAKASNLTSGSVSGSTAGSASTSGSSTNSTSGSGSSGSTSGSSSAAGVTTPVTTSQS
jgi:hypothetical protein